MCLFSAKNGFVIGLNTIFSEICMERVTILGGEIDVITRSAVQQKIHNILADRTQTKMYTPNPEMLVLAHDEEIFRDILNAGNLNICDGFGITLVSTCSKKLPRIERFPGVDCMLDICRIAEETGKKIFLLGGESDLLLEKTKTELQKKFPRLLISGYYQGPYISHIKDSDILFSLNEDENEKSIDRIIDAAPDILFVAFGHGKQEWWIDRYIQELPSVAIAMGVGGSFDFISGKTKRAPNIFRQLGLEWTWRLFLQPWRIMRIWNATIRFLYLFFFRS